MFVWRDFMTSVALCRLFSHRVCTAVREQLLQRRIKGEKNERNVLVYDKCGKLTLITKGSFVTLVSQLLLHQSDYHLTKRGFFCFIITLELSLVGKTMNESL